MPTTKPPKPSDAAPTYDRQAERRAALIRDVEAILDAEAWAYLDRDAVGFPKQYRASDMSRSTVTVTVNEKTGEEEAALNPVEAAALAKASSQATDWLSERKEALSALTRAANLARAYWAPAPPVGAVSGGVTVGQRGSTVETCQLCQLPIVGGRTDPLKRLDGDPFHAKNSTEHGWCYHTALRARGRLGTVPTSPDDETAGQAGD